MKSNERIHYKIQVCLQNLALRKLKKSITENHENLNEMTNVQDQANSNLKPLNFESSSTEFSTSKERVDLLQDFQSPELQLDIRNLSKEPRRAIEKYIDIKENGHVNKTEMADDTILLRNVRLSLPILRVKTLEHMSHEKIMCPKLAIKNNVNIKNNGDGDTTINEINREVSKKEILFNVSSHENKKKDFHEKEVEDTANLVSQDVSKVEQTPSDNPIMNRKQLMDSRHYFEIAKKSQDEKSLDFLRPCLKMIPTKNDPTQSVLKQANGKCSFDDSTLVESRELCKACSLIQKQNREYLSNKHDKHASPYLTTYINENIKDNSFYQCCRHYCGENMINDLSRIRCCYRSDYNESYGRWDIQKKMLGNSRNKYRHHICKVRGNSSISCGCKSKVIPTAQRVTFCLPNKKETT